MLDLIAGFPCGSLRHPCSYAVFFAGNSVHSLKTKCFVLKTKISLQKNHLIGINGKIKSVHQNNLLKDTFIYKVYEVGNPKRNDSPNRSRN